MIKGYWWSDGMINVCYIYLFINYYSVIKYDLVGKSEAETTHLYQTLIVSNILNSQFKHHISCRLLHCIFNLRLDHTTTTFRLRLAACIHLNTQALGYRPSEHKQPIAYCSAVKSKFSMNNLLHR